MKRGELLDKIADLLRQHNGGFLGSVNQEPYKRDLFSLFAAAFNAGFIDSPSKPGYLSAYGAL